jgi:hypothetical protein
MMGRLGKNHGKRSALRVALQMLLFQSLGTRTAGAQPRTTVLLLRINKRASSLARGALYRGSLGIHPKAPESDARRRLSRP